MARITAEQFEGLYWPLHGQLLRYAGARVGKDRAEDAVAHARMRAIKAMGRYDHRHVTAFQAWMYLLVRSVCEGYTRHDRYVIAGEREMVREGERAAMARVDILVVDRQEAADRLREVAAVADAVFMSAEQRRAMIGLLGGEPDDLVAERMGVSLATARRRQAEAIEIVRRAMIGEE